MAASSSAGDIVTDGLDDIAKRMNLDAVMVEVVGRERFQKAWLWTGSNGGCSTTNYDPAKHGPDKGQELKLHLHENETIPHPNAREFLEIGLVYASDTRKGLKKDPSGNKALSAKKKDKEPGRRNDEFMMRVFTPIVSHIQDQNKCYVGCLPMDGRLNQQLVKAECVFFYPEFREGIPETTPQTQFGKRIMANIRVAAAVNKSAQRSTNVVITADQLSKKLTAHPLVVTQAEHLVSSLTLKWDLYLQTGDIACVRAMIKDLEQAHPDLKFGPGTSIEGLANFMDFENPIPDESVETLKDEIRFNYPQIDPDVMLIKMIHVQLCKLPGDSANVSCLGERLQIGGFGFFMQLMHKKMSVLDKDSAGEYDETALTFHINDALEATDIHLQHSPGSSWTPSKKDPKAGGKITVRGLASVLTDVCNVLKKVDRFSEESMEEIANLHGGVLKSASFKGLMSKVADSVDKSSLQVVFEQTSALHSALCAQNNVVCGEILKGMVTTLGKILILTEKSLDETDEVEGDEDGGS